MDNKIYNIVIQLLEHIDPYYRQNIHLKDSPKRVTNYYETLLQFQLSKNKLAAEYKRSVTDREVIDHLLNITIFEEDEDYTNKNINNNILVGPIKVYSLCAHHFAPIIGNVWIAYKPNKKILGLSKLSRIAKLYARQPIIQELYTEGLYNLIKEYTNSDNVNIVTYMRHLCMESRGVQDTNSITLVYYMDDETLLSKINLEKP